MARDWISFLVTGPENNLMAFQFEAMWLVEFFDRRKQTVRCRAFGVSDMTLRIGAAIGADMKGDPQKTLNEAIELAKKHDVTVEELQGAGSDERVIMRWLASHGRKWNDGKRWSKKDKEWTEQSS